MNKAVVYNIVTLFVVHNVIHNAIYKDVRIRWDLDPFRIFFWTKLQRNRKMSIFEFYPQNIKEWIDTPMAT